MNEKTQFEEAVALLQNLISVKSYSNDEDKAADIWESWLKAKEADVKRYHNNVFALSKNFNPANPILLLNSHLDTVQPSGSYTMDPFNPEIKDGRLYGLGSNDAGGAAVCLASTFLNLEGGEGLPFNLLLAITASEERMGPLGMRAFLPYLREEGIYPSMAIVGEPTSCKAAIAERGLVVCDATVKGKAGHAARNEGVNAIYRALEDIKSIRDIKWEKESGILGPIKATVTVIEAGKQHNVVPDLCKYVIDIRTTDALTNEETVEGLRKETKWSELVPRSTHIRASVLPMGHPLILAAENAGLNTFISPTTSDMALMHDIPSIKIGPGESARSHTADEYILLEEVEEGLSVYERMIEELSKV